MAELALNAAMFDDDAARAASMLEEELERESEEARCVVIFVARVAN